MGVGEWFAGPIADSVGRKPTLQSGILVFAIGTLAVLIAPNFTVLLIGRFIQGIGLAFVKISSRAMLRDLYSGDDLARAMSFMTTIFVFVPMVAPIFGEIIYSLFGWRTIVWFWLFASLILLAWFSCRQAETLNQEQRRSLYSLTFFASIVDILKSPLVVGVIAALGCIWGAQLLYIANAKSVYSDIFEINNHFGFYFAVVASSIGLSALINALVVKRMGAIRLAFNALVVFFVLSTTDILLLITLSDYTFRVFIVFSWLKFFCFGFVFGNLNAIGMGGLGHVAGLGSTLMSAISSLVGLILSASIGLFYTSTLYPILSGFAVLGLLALILLKWAINDQETKTQ